MPLPTRTYSLRIHIATAFCLLVLLTSGSIVWLAYQRSSIMLERAAVSTATHTGHSLISGFERLLDPVRSSLLLLSADVANGLQGDVAQRLRALPAYLTALQAAPAAVAFYSADEDGNYFLVRRLLGHADRQHFAAPDAAHYLVQTVERYPDASRSHYVFLDAARRQLSLRESQQHLGFDARQRPWYLQAQAAAGERILTAPYRFFSTGQQGISLAQLLADGRRVVGADLRLQTLSNQLAAMPLPVGARLQLQDEHGGVLAATTAGADAGLAAAWQAIAPSATLQAVSLSGQRWLSGRLPLPQVERRPLFLALAVSEQALLADALAMRQQLLLLCLGLLVAAMLLAWWLAARIASPLARLMQASESMRRLQFDQPLAIRSRIVEVDHMAATLELTQTTLGDFLALLARISQEEDFQRLLPQLLAGTCHVTRLPGGLLLMGEGERLQLAAAHWQGAALSPPAGEALQPLLAHAATVLASRQPQPWQPDAALQQALAIAAPHAWSVPLCNRQGQAIGVLVLLAAAPLDAARQSFVQALSGFAAVALETRELIASQKALFAAFIELMAGAIDAKSPYTGGHCARVPELARLLADAACRQQSGPYAGFSMDEQQWEALHIAAWLHDCGKVTTPEYVVDKATKLETLYDRIHEVRMRFEVLKRDARIASLQQQLAGVPAAEAQQQCEAVWAQLDEEFAFVAACNQGGEYMAPERVARLQGIAARQWQRTLDDRLGVSADELRRMEATPAPALPVAEPLLADKPQHRIARSDSERFGPGNPWGFAMAVPALQYDRGELKNLQIARGTLAEEERFKINEHIMQSVMMLSALPFPRHLAAVPEIAGNHHERIDGNGYPRGLRGEQMSPLARMMAIADVFEALTASDRPYKPAKPLSQTLAIMKSMAEQGHIDAELFTVFLQGGVARQYAARFLVAEQDDVDDVTAYLPAGSSKINGSQP